MKIKPFGNFCENNKIQSLTFKLQQLQWLEKQSQILFKNKKYDLFYFMFMIAQEITNLSPNVSKATKSTRVTRKFKFWSIFSRNFYLMYCLIGCQIARFGKL